MESEFKVTPNNDGTVSLSHYGTRYDHWWVAEVKKRRSGYAATIYGKMGGSAFIALSRQEADSLWAAREQAQEMAILEDKKKESRLNEVRTAAVHPISD